MKLCSRGGHQLVLKLFWDQTRVFSILIATKGPWIKPSHAGRLKTCHMGNSGGAEQRGGTVGGRGGRERGRVEDREGGGEGRRERRKRKNSYLPMAYGFVHLNPLAH